MTRVRDKIRLILDVRVENHFYPSGSRGMVVTKHGDKITVAINKRREIIPEEFFVVEREEVTE